MSSGDPNVVEPKTPNVSRTFSVKGAAFLASLNILSTAFTSRTWLDWLLAGALGLTWLVLIIHLARRQKGLPSARSGVALKLLYALVLTLLLGSVANRFLGR